MIPGLIANRRRKWKAGRVETPYAHEDLDALASEAVDATDEVMGRRQRARLIVEELKRRVATDRAATLVLAAFEAEIDDPQEQARAADLSMQSVYNARTKLRTLAREIAQTFDRGSLQ
jgi:nitroreductase